MAVENLSSTAISNSVATPTVANTAGRGAAGELKQVTAPITPAADATTASTYLLFRVPSNAVPTKLGVIAADMSDGRWDIGVQELDGTVLDANLLGSVDFGEGPHTGDNRLYTSITGVPGTIIAIADAEKPLWEALGLSADPHTEYVVYGTSIETQTDATPVRVTLDYIV